MIGFLMGKVLFSDNTEVILLTGDGVGHQVYFSGILPEGSEASIYISHVIKEGSQELFGFRSLKEKKFFELLIGVKGVGPKSAFSLMASLNINMIINSILYEDKKTLTKAPGVGP